MTKLAIISGIAAQYFEDGVSAPVVALVADEGYCLVGCLGEDKKEDVVAHFIEQGGADGSDLPPVFLWPMLVGQCISKDSNGLEDATVEVIYDFDAAA
jgi:hypothetical protein